MHVFFTKPSSSIPLAYINPKRLRMIAKYPPMVSSGGCPVMAWEAPGDVFRKMWEFNDMKVFRSIYAL